jgi:hypothetical protein
MRIPLETPAFNFAVMWSVLMLDILSPRAGGRMSPKLYYFCLQAINIFQKKNVEGEDVPLMVGSGSMRGRTLTTFLHNRTLLLRPMLSYMQLMHMHLMHTSWTISMQ